MTMDSQGAQRPGLMTFTQKSHRDPPNGFLGYNANGQRGLEGAHRATETSWVPLPEKSSTYEVFVGAFLFLRGFISPYFQQVLHGLC